MQIQQILSKYNITPQKKFGQNFLIDNEVINKLLKTANLNKKDIVLEVGPGLGSLTTRIAPEVKKLIAVEFDRNMIPILKEQTQNTKNLQILNQDILDFQPRDWKLEARNYKLIGAIPYQITSPLIHKIINWNNKPIKAVLMIQKEVAEKICATNKKASYLSNFVSSFGEAKIIKIVPPQSFYPSPKVNSAIIEINFFEKSLVSDPKKFSYFLHRGFSSPRKMIHHSFDKELLQSVNIDNQLRPEKLTLTKWIALYKRLQNCH